MCHKNKNIDNFHFSNIVLDKRNNCCKDCQKEKYQRWYLKHKRKRTRKDLDYILKWQKENKIKYSAEARLKYAVKVNKIKKPDICSICKLKKRIYGHHTDYTKIYEVIWVCGSCHKRLHTGSLKLSKY
jgi:ribosomal protein L37AE/L43A